ncbi:hypothetical protein QQ008_18555 [Fulvivirgaceae bacterium BMA10]|uniref:DUF3108 domain-containing protein n=2 Tax=Splendidivirga corallicola TaxID=3051826 RepID=A0ABT8KRJ9_9BACT|nr:hypothetical protein [Fulvivirgaceae bacterium BMA10]
MSEGTEFEMTNYDSKGKADSRVKHKVLEKTVSGGDVMVKVSMELYDKKDELVNSGEYEVKCEGGVFKVDMRSLINLEQTKAYANMEATVDADQLEIPSNPKAGDELADGFMEITFGPVIKMRVNVTDRKVEAIENVTTDAGTFNCIKISENIDSQIMIAKVKAKSVAWYSKDVGTVKTESYNKKGKLMGYSVLTNFKQ